MFSSPHGEISRTGNTDSRASGGHRTPAGPSEAAPATLGSDEHVLSTRRLAARVGPAPWAHAQVSRLAGKNVQVKVNAKSTDGR